MQTKHKQTNWNEYNITLAVFCWQNSSTQQYWQGQWFKKNPPALFVPVPKNYPWEYQTQKTYF
ncbi:MAG: hypothetical protein RLZZ69_3513 [Cyanobacteriota bacterium]|jgi:2-polyprenyl-6-methoxyphenol hydroxylase-like FAD-dependent oxidoreductase